MNGSLGLIYGSASQQ